MRKKYIQDSFFSSQLLQWYEFNKRNLPWRQTNNPYVIWLSEIILQQTRVDQGLPYYMKFVESYPHVSNLANASEDEVFKLWQGLGYYNRARNLHATAKYIMSNYGGNFPTKQEDVIALKGVGEYTAAAIMSFAYNEPYAAVDGNVYRVLSRVFGIEDYIDTSAGKKIFQELADQLLDRDQPGLFNQAMMDFGSLQCVPKSPNCGGCPFNDMCYAYNKGTISDFPKKRGKVKVRERFFNYIDVHSEGNLYLRKRSDKDIWSGLYEFPLIETTEEQSWDTLVKSEEYKNLFPSSTIVKVVSTMSLKHVLSHQIIYANFYQVETDGFNDGLFVKIPTGDFENYAVSRMTHKYMEGK